METTPTNDLICQTLRKVNSDKYLLDISHSTLMFDCDGSYEDTQRIHLRTFYSITKIRWISAGKMATTQYQYSSSGIYLVKSQEMATPIQM